MTLTIVARRPRSCSDESSAGSGGGGCVDEARSDRGNGAGSRSAAAAAAKHSNRVTPRIVNCSLRNSLLLVGHHLRTSTPAVVAPLRLDPQRGEQGATAGARGGGGRSVRGGSRLGWARRLRCGV